MPLAGLEPARIAPLDFESSASTNSATAANNNTIYCKKYNIISCSKCQYFFIFLNNSKNPIAAGDYKRSGQTCAFAAQAART